MADGRERGPAPGNHREALDWGREYLAGRGLDDADLEAQVLLAARAGIDRAHIFSRDGQPLLEEKGRSYQQAVRERGEGVPLAYLLGRREFWSLEFAVDGSVLIPRPETEGIVEAALELLRPGCRVADIGTGSGNIIAALASELKGDEWLAADISPEAVAVADANIRLHGFYKRINTLRSDLFEVLGTGKGEYDAILSNPPYIPTGDLDGLQEEVRMHEPRIALDGGKDGLGLIRRLVKESPPHLKEDGFLIMEVGFGQAVEVMEIVKGDGSYRCSEVRRDLSGLERIIVAERG